MGSLVTRIQGFCGRMHPMKASVTVCGLDGGGKTTILYRLKLNETVNTFPTVGCNVETLEIGSEFSLVLWDVGIGAKGQTLIRHYLYNSQGFAFVVDSTDAERFNEVKETLYLFMNHYAWDLPFIVLANKQDLEGACSPSELAQHLDLEKIPTRRWKMCGCCGTTGEGLHEAFQILSTMIKEDKLH